MGFRKIFKNTFAILIARIIFRVCNALAVIVIARYLGVEKFGVYSTALALVNTFLIANDIGSATLLMRKGSRDHSKINIYFGNSILIQLIASAIFFTVALIVGYILDYNATTMFLVVLLGAAVIVFEFRKSFRAILRILLKLKFIAAAEALIGIGMFVSIFSISKFISDKDTGLLMVGSVPLIFNILFITSLLIYNSGFVKPKFSVSRIWPMIKEGYLYSIYNIAYIIYFQISILMVQAISGNTEAGIYSAAAKIIILIFIVPQMIFQVAVPLMFKYSKQDFDKYKRIHHIIFRYLSATGIPIAVGIWLLAEPIIEFVYNKQGYLPAATALKIFAILLVFRFVGNVAGQSLTTFDKQKQKVIVQLLNIVLLVVLNYFLIKAYGFIGAAIATVATEIIIRLWFMILDFKYLKQKAGNYLIALPGITLAAAIMGACVYFTKPYLHVILAILFGALIYGLFLWAFRFFKPYDVKLFKQLLPKNKQ